jgi:hypothetical protein
LLGLVVLFLLLTFQALFALTGRSLARNSVTSGSAEMAQQCAEAYHFES